MSTITPIFTFDIICFDVLPTYKGSSGNNLTNVVQSVYFSLTATYNDYTTTIPSTCSLLYPSPGSFITFTDLTKDLVATSINQNCYALPSQQQILTNNILSQFQPAVVNMSPPFS